MSQYFDDISIAADAIHLEARKSGIDMAHTTARRMATVAMDVFRREIPVREEEEPQWWYYEPTPQAWFVSADQSDSPPYLNTHSGECRIYGTRADRDAKRDDLLEAARKAGKP